LALSAAQITRKSNGYIVGSSIASNNGSVLFCPEEWKRLSFKSIIKVIRNEPAMSPKVRDLLFGASDTKEPKKSPKPASNSPQTQSDSATRAAPSTVATAALQNVTPIAGSHVTEHQKQAKTPPSSAPHPPTAEPEQARPVKGKRRPKNTVVVSLQMPAALVKVLDEIVELGAYRSRSDLILQAVRSHTDVSKRLTLLKPKQPAKK
jgi:hypothetical protein